MFKHTELTGTEKEKALKEIPRQLINTFLAISIFLLLPSIVYYIRPWPILQYARDIGILILTIGLYFLHKKMKNKKQKEAKE